MSPKKTYWHAHDDDEYDEFYDDEFYSEYDDDDDYEETATYYNVFAEYATPADAIIIKGPIQAISRRGDFGVEWWGKQWIAALSSLGGEGRLERGKSYARNGQVRVLEIGKGLAYARVKGSSPRPYQTAVELQAFTDEEWNQALTALASQLIYTAKLLAGEMPSDIEAIFKGIHLSLFPRNLKDIHFYCTCPDDGAPCKHAAAVYYLLAEQIDANPFVLFHLRGRTKDQVLSALRGVRSDGSSATDQAASAIDADLANFWSMPAALPTLSAPNLPDMPQIFEELGDFPHEDMKELLALYRAIGRAALDTLTQIDAEQPSTTEDADPA